MGKTVITMPAFRAGLTLAKTVADIPEGVADELILVDDASPDNTVELARSLGIKVFVHPENRGYGGNQKTCYTMALAEDADVVVLLHPDYQYEPKAVPLLIAPILAGDADMTFGSRFAGLGDPRAGGMPLYRYVGNRLTTMIQNWMLGSRFTEMHSGMRAYTRDCLLSMPFLRYSDDFLFDEQFLVDAVTAGQRVVEVPIPTRYTKESSSISVLRSLKYVIRGVAYCAQVSAERGRRGRKWPVTMRTVEAGPSIGRGPKVEQACVLCGGLDHTRIDRNDTSAALLQCDACGLVGAARREDAPGLVRNFPPIVDAAYLERESARRVAFDWIARQMGGFVVDGRRLIEAGSHAGLFLDVARRWGWDGRGVAAPPWSVEMGRERFGVDMTETRLEELKEEPDSIDAIALVDVLGDMEDPLATARRAHELLREKGILALLTPLPADNGEPPQPSGRRYYFGSATLRALLDKAGFRIVDWSALPKAARFPAAPQPSAAQPAETSSAASEEMVLVIARPS